MLSGADHSVKEAGHLHAERRLDIHVATFTSSRSNSHIDTYARLPPQRVRCGDGGSQYLRQPAEIPPLTLIT